MALTICAKCKREWQANSGIEPCPWCRASSAESSLAAMRQRAEETISYWKAHAEHMQFGQEIDAAARDAAISRAERAEACLRRVQRLADDGVDDPAGPHNVLAHIASAVETAMSSEKEMTSD